MLTVLVISTIVELINYIFIFRVVYKLNIYYEQYREKVDRDTAAKENSDREYFNFKMLNIIGGNETSEATSRHK